MNKFHSTLARDITLILIIKGVALYLIWLAWFSSPQDEHLDAAGIGKALITPSPQEPSHARH
jgi:hypothetical protein